MLGTSGDGVDEKGNPTGSYRDQMIDGLHGFQDELRNSIAVPIRLEDIETWHWFQKWTLLLKIYVMNQYLQTI